MDIVSETKIVVDKCCEDMNGFETRLSDMIVVDKCCQDMNGFETRLSDIRFVVQEQWWKKGEDHAAPSDSIA